MSSDRPVGLQRSSAIDAVKGVGILAVAIGHTFPGMPYLATMSFSMPLFFFVSGYLFKPGHPPGRYFVDKAISLMLPYAAFTTLIYTAQYFYRDEWQSCSSTTFHCLAAYAKPLVLGAQALRGWCAVCWFIPVLFLTQQVANLLVGRIGTRAMLMSCLVSTLLAYINALYMPRVWLPLDAQVVLMALPIFYCGYLYRQHERHAVNLLAVCGALAALGLLARDDPIAYDMKASIYGVPGLSLFTALSMTVCVLLLCRLMTRWTALTRIFVTLGSASLVIMFVHEPVQLYLLEGAKVESGMLRLIICVAAGYLAFVIIQRFAVSRALLLGTKADLYFVARRISALLFARHRLSNR